jgi:putative endonuclease
VLLQSAHHHRAAPIYGRAMTIARQRLGRLAEGVVCARLTAEGWRLVALNARVDARRGEIDVIALDGPTLVFVEVKARRSDAAAGPELPVMAVDARKRARLRSLAVAWLRDPGSAVPRHRGIRFDVVGVRLEPAGRLLDYQHLRGAF